MQTREHFLKVRRDYNKSRAKQFCATCGLQNVCPWNKNLRCRECWIKSRKGYNNANSIKAIAGYWKGKKQPPELIEKRIQKLRGRKRPYKSVPKMKGRWSAEKNPLWKGGISTINPRAYKSHMQSERRVRKMGNGGSHTLEQWIAVKRINAYLCSECGNMEPFIRLSKDHIKPLSKGGTDDISNIQPLCIPCNSRKNNKYPDATSTLGAVPKYCKAK